MKIEFLVLVITGFLMVNTYYDGKYVEILKKWTKYYKIIGYGFIGFTLYLYIKKYPRKSQGLVTSASNLVRCIPVDKNTKDILTPLIDFTKSKEQTSKIFKITEPFGSSYESPQFKRMMQSGKKANKRSVSETKKKYVASSQNWKCKKCNQQLDASFEVDHRIDLQFGGSNHVSNLEALCRNCHGKKGLLHKL